MTGVYFIWLHLYIVWSELVFFMRNVGIIQSQELLKNHSKMKKFSHTIALVLLTYHKVLSILANPVVIQWRNCFPVVVLEFSHHKAHVLGSKFLQNNNHIPFVHQLLLLKKILHSIL